jgi:hypothetical protein
MHFILLFGRPLERRLNSLDLDGSWTELARLLDDGLAADQRLDYKAPTEGVPESKLSIFGSHLTLLTFGARAAAEAAILLISERIAQMPLEDSLHWDVRTRLIEQVDRFASLQSGGGFLPAHAGMFQVSWKVPPDLLPSFSAWYEEHLRWHSHTFTALDARRLVSVGDPTLLSYPYDVTAMYWFEQRQEIVDMCVDLVERGNRGWPDVAQWSARTLSDRSPFILISE